MEVKRLVILGGGPSGYTAALYAARAGLEPLLLERLAAGGQMALTPLIENYPGFPDGIDGFTLGDAMRRGAEQHGAVSESTEVLSCLLTESPKRIVTDSGEYLADAVIIATGAEHRRLGLPDEERLLGRGVGYCATCDGMLYRGKRVSVVGGGNTAVTDALYLAGIAEHVTLIHRRASLRAEKRLAEQLLAKPNVTVLWEREVVGLSGDTALSSVTLRSTKTGEDEVLEAAALFISIGQIPKTSLFAGQLALDEAGYLVAGEDTVTSLPGVFAAGDVRTKPLRQIVTAVADGATAAHMAEAYLNAQTGEQK